MSPKEKNRHRNRELQRLQQMGARALDGDYDVVIVKVGRGEASRFYFEPLNKPKKGDPLQERLT